MEKKLDRAAMGRLAKALVFVCGPDHPITVALQAAAESGSESRHQKCAHARCLIEARRTQGCIGHALRLILLTPNFSGEHNLCFRSKLASLLYSSSVLRRGAHLAPELWRASREKRFPAADPRPREPSVHT